MNPAVQRTLPLGRLMRLSAILTGFVILCLATASAGEGQPPPVQPPQPPAEPARPATEPAAAAVTATTGLAGGLAVVVGDGLDGFVVDLARGGRWLVHALGTDPAAVAVLRGRINAAGLAGLATAELRPDLNRLPWRSALANLVVDTSGSDAAAWTVRRAPQSDPAGDWTHDYRRPDMNMVVQGQRPGLPTGMQWMAGWSPPDHNAPLVASGVVLQEESGHNFFLAGQGSGMAAPRFTVRDADNGILLWEGNQEKHANYATIVADGRVYWFPKEWTPKSGLPMRSAEARTGAGIIDFTEGARWRMLDKAGGRDIACRTMVIGDLLIQAWDRTVYALDVRSGALRWSWTTDQPRLNALAGGHDGQVIVGEGENHLVNVRYYGSRKATGVVALGLADGALRWRAPAPEGELGQIIAQPGHVVLVASGHHAWNTEWGHVTVLDSRTGAKRWQKGTGQAFGDFNGGLRSDQGQDASGSNAVVIDGHVVMNGSFWLMTYRLSDGEHRFFRHGVNQGCQRLIAFPDSTLLLSTVPTLITGILGPPDRLTWSLNTVQHADCAQGFIPSRDRLYLKSIVQCSCSWGIKLNQCLTKGQTPAPADDATRRSTLAPPQPVDRHPGTDAGRWQSSRENNGFYNPPRLFSEYGLAYDWVAGAYSPLGTLATYASVPVPISASGCGPSASAGAVTVTPLVHRQVAIATRGGVEAWRFQAYGRLAAQPLIDDGTVYLPGRDGWLYALDAVSGAMRWRFLAARSDLRLVNSGQVESVWPCIGAVLHEGLVWTAAGLAVDLDGGVMVWGLDRDGTVRRRITVRGRITSGGAPRADNKGSLVLGMPYGHVKGGGFAVQDLRVQDGRLCLAYWWAKHAGPGSWRLLPVATGADGVQEVDRASVLGSGTPAKP